MVAEQSVGELFLGAVFPGLLLSRLYILYVLARSYADPKLSPPIPVEERISFAAKLRLLETWPRPSP